MAITLSVILIAAASGLFFTTLRSDSKKTSVTELKDNGDYAISQIEFLLRNAITLDRISPTDPLCTTGMSQIVFRSVDNNLTRLYLSNNQIASESSATGTTRYLTGGPVAASSLVFDCQQAAQGIGTYIKISFHLAYATTSGTLSIENASDDFVTTVNIRSF